MKKFPRLIFQGNLPVKSVKKYLKASNAVVSNQWAVRFG